jgi:hypothetical protein
VAADSELCRITMMSDPDGRKWLPGSLIMVMRR